MHLSRIVSICLVGIALSGCNSRLVKPDQTTAVELRNLEQVKLSYTILPASPKVSGSAENAFRESLAGLGIRDAKPADAPDGERTHIVVYKLEGKYAPITRFTWVPMVFIELGTLGLMPYCEQFIHPLELHVFPPVAEGNHPVWIIRDEFITSECMWFPMFGRYDMENDLLRHAGLLAVFDRALQEIVTRERGFSDVSAATP